MAASVSHPGYERYWQQFNFIQNWVKKHQRVVHDTRQQLGSQTCSCGNSAGRLSRPMDPMPLPDTAPVIARVPPVRLQATPPVPHSANLGAEYHEFKVPPIPLQSEQREEATSEACDQRLRPAGRTVSSKSKRSKAKRRKRNRSRTSSQSSTDNELLEAEIDTDFIDFMRKSAQHKQEREAKKTKEDSERMEVDSQGYMVDENIRKSAPTEQPGMRRTHEIKLLYGDKSHKIHGMETAQQLCFQQACDKMKPLHWPNIPLRLHFS